MMGLYGLIRLGRQIDVYRVKYTSVTDAGRVVDSDENKVAIVDLRTLRIADGLQLNAKDREKLERRLSVLTSGERCQKCRGPVLAAEPPRVALCLWCAWPESKQEAQESPSRRESDPAQPQRPQGPSVGPGTPVPHTPWGYPSPKERQEHEQAVRACLRSIAKALGWRVQISASGGPSFYVSVWGHFSSGHEGWIEIFTACTEAPEPPTLIVRQGFSETVGGVQCKRTGPNHSIHTVEDAIGLARELDTLHAAEWKCGCSRCALRKACPDEAMRA